MKRLLLVAALLVACSDSTDPVAPGFLGGTDSNHEIGVVVNSLGKSVTLFQLGSPGTQVSIPLGTSSTITPVSLSLRGRRAAVPLGNAGSVALVNLETQTIARYFTFASGNATGAAWANDTTIFVANQVLDKVGRMYVNQTGDAIDALADVAPEPSAVIAAGGRIAVVSANLDENFLPIGNGIVTFIDPTTMQVQGAVELGGTNSTDAALGPDGLLYVINTGDFVTDGSLTIVDPASMQVVTTVEGIGAGPGAISVDSKGTALISSFFNGTLVFNTATRTFTRPVANSVCAKANDVCRGAFAAATDSRGDIYQAFFGSPSEDLPPYIFVFDASDYSLKDSISVGVGPSSIAIRRF